MNSTPVYKCHQINFFGFPLSVSTAHNSQGRRHWLHCMLEIGTQHNYISVTPESLRHLRKQLKGL